MDEISPRQSDRPLQLKPTPKRSMLKSVAGGIWYVFVLSLVFIVATGASWVGQSGLMKEVVVGKIKETIGFAPKPPRDVFGGDSLTLLVLGCDQNLADTYSKRYKERIKKKFLETGVRPHISREIRTDSARTDMMLVVKLDFINKTISGLSIPRDLEVALPGYRSQKINGYHTYGKTDDGSADLITKEAVEYVLPGVHIDRVMTLDYDAFQNVVNMVGGVPINEGSPHLGRV